MEFDEASALLADWADAIVSNDPNAIGRFAAPDWILVGENGILPSSRFLALVASGDLTHDVMTFEVVRVGVHADTAVVTSRSMSSGAYVGESFRLEEWTSDVFVRDGESWKCILTHVTPAIES
jgi:ketosteroid isomerase-like protein